MLAAVRLAHGNSISTHCFKLYLSRGGFCKASHKAALCEDFHLSSVDTRYASFLHVRAPTLFLGSLTRDEESHTRNTNQGEYARGICKGTMRGNMQHLEPSRHVTSHFATIVPHFRKRKLVQFEFHNGIFLCCILLSVFQNKYPYFLLPYFIQNRLVVFIQLRQLMTQCKKDIWQTLARAVKYLQRKHE